MDEIKKIVGETQKMLRAVINGQASLKQELINEFRNEIRRVEQKLESRMDNL